MTKEQEKQIANNTFIAVWDNKQNKLVQVKSLDELEEMTKRIEKENT